VPRQVSRKRIFKFKQAVDYLLSKGILQDAIGKKMQMAASNFNSYFQEEIPITHSFLARFHDAWKDELEPEDADESGVEGITEIYRIHDTIVEKLVDGQNKLIHTNANLVEYHQKLIDALLGLGIKPEPRDGL
jgi:hypothetical protein